MEPGLPSQTVEALNAQPGELEFPPLPSGMGLIHS